MFTNAQERLQLEIDLRHAIEREEFLVHYQPVVETTSGIIIGVEALVRWNHPLRGMVHPADFIPVAEETGLIVQIGEWVLRTACAQGRLWHDAGLAVSVAVNFSARQFRQPDMSQIVAACVAETGLAPRFLTVEITETTVMEHAEAFTKTLRKLKEIGVTIAIDDFGTGYSSLSYLKRFPIDTLKIDHSFVRDIGIGTSDAAIVTATIALAHHLNLTVVAEGVESEHQLNFLRAHRCNEIQGYVYSPPISSERLTTLLLDGQMLRQLPSRLNTS
jgi:EAL domain-containing protein (putative c-di-GMP-specific phosphodiesterase class I)